MFRREEDKLVKLISSRNHSREGKTGDDEFQLPALALEEIELILCRGFLGA
ncbi:MAG: hypothetical protein ACJATN_000727 [Neolewinella sp.]|jgi:hypothetical protein